MNNKNRQTTRVGLAQVGAIWFVLLIGLWLFLPEYTLGAEGNAVSLPHGAVGRLGTGRIMAVKYSPDGKTLVSGPQDNTVLLRDVEGIIKENERKVQAGGVQFVLQLQGISEISPALCDYAMDRLITVLTNRIDLYGIANAEIRRIGTDQILVKLPGAKDPEQARTLIGQTGALQVMKVVKEGTSPYEDLVAISTDQEILFSRDGIPYIVDRQPLLTGAALSNAQARTSQYIQNTGQLFVALTLNPKGAQQFVDVAQQLKVGDRLAIVLDNVIYSTPLITQEIKDEAARGWQAVQNSIIIQGPFTGDETTRIAIVLRTGVLPVPVKVIQESPL